MSLKEKLLAGIGDVIAPIVRLLVEQIFTQVVFPRLKDSSPEGLAVVLTSIYGPIDVYAEAAVDGTETALDDAVVDGLMSAIEQTAGQEGIELPQLDED